MMVVLPFVIVERAVAAQREPIMFNSCRSSKRGGFVLKNAFHGCDPGLIEGLSSGESELPGVNGVSIPWLGGYRRCEPASA
jgi:hypothetical protein